MDNELAIIDRFTEIDSLAVAEMTGKDHFNVLRDIRSLEKRLVNSDLIALWKSDSYEDKQGKIQLKYSLTKVGSLLLASQYDPKVNLALILRWEKLENERIGLLKEDLIVSRENAKRLYWEANPEEYRSFRLMQIRSEEENR